MSRCRDYLCAKQRPHPKVARRWRRIFLSLVSPSLIRPSQREVGIAGKQPVAGAWSSSNRGEPSTAAQLLQSILPSWNPSAPRNEIIIKTGREREKKRLVDSLEFFSLRLKEKKKTKGGLALSVETGPHTSSITQIYSELIPKISYDNLILRLLIESLAGAALDGLRVWTI